MANKKSSSDAPPEALVGAGRYGRDGALVGAGRYGRDGALVGAGRINNPPKIGATKVFKNGLTLTERAKFRCADSYRVFLRPAPTNYPWVSEDAAKL